jgi:type I restriction enzyme M protein
VVLAKGALTSKTSGEGDIRKALVADGNLIDCIVNLPAKLFLNTQIPAALWFMNRSRSLPSPADGECAARGAKPAGDEGLYPRKNEILFIDARNLGHPINRRTKELAHEDIQQIADTYHAWRTGEAVYEDVKGFCASVPLAKVQELDYVLTPGRYVGLPDEEDDFNFAERFAALKAEFEAQLQEEARLNKAIAENLVRMKV